MKKIKVLVLAAVLVTGMFSMNSCGKAETSEITNNVLEKFTELTQIPRPSKHEEQVSNFLKEWAEGQNFDVVQDEVNNLIIEVPATEGMEDKPLVVLQGHMDMVFAQADGLDLDPLTTKIEVVNDGETLASDGNTSLGADDGIGLAIMECVAEGKMNHGPLRIIITTDEEQGMTGAKALDTKYVKDVDYMINIDDDIAGEIVISSASGNNFTFSGKTTDEKPVGDMGVQIKLSGLTGGHSGNEIHEGRMNGILSLGNILQDLEKSNIDYEIVSISGGNATNAIPTGVKATLCISSSDYDKFSESCNNTVEKLKEKYAETDPNTALEITEAKKPQKVISASDTEKIITFFKEKNDGVYTMSEIIDGLVESSTNLGMISVDTKNFSAQGMIRSSSKEKEKELLELNDSLASKLGYEIKNEAASMAWPAKKDNVLEKLAVESYKEIFSEDLDVIAIHAGLECGYFADINPNLNIISMGPNISDSHSITERIEISSIDKTWKLLEGILAEIE